MHLVSFILVWLNTLFRQLRLSVSSVNFYKDVYRNYQGYGIRYLFVVSFIPSIIYCIFVLNYITTLKDYFDGKHLSKATENIEYIINQLPDIQYNGTKISLEEEEPLYLYSKNKNKIVAIDINNQLPLNEKSKIPIILTANKLIINLVEATTKKKLTTDIEYFKIFGPNQKALTPEIVKKYCADSLDKIPGLFIYIGMPIILLFWFVTFLFEKSFIILLVYVLTNLFGPKTPMKICIRLVMFASGVPILLQPIITLLSPALGEVILFLQMFTVGLLFAALWQIKNKEIFGKYS
ncbi:MAG: DUF1189 domain-containing protein [Rickettsia endosymbiont of Oxypoda opaca]|nr:DUF1189 domain-containing protein [Rickettsia endosymbiont of Oxypoda opaca]